MAQQEKEEPRGKRELILEAAFKVFSGQKLVDEGNFEIDALLGEHSLKKAPSKKGPLTPGQKSALTKKAKKKLIAHRKTDSDFRKDNRTDEKILNKMVDIVRKNRQASTILFKKKLKLSERRLHKLLGIAQGRGLLHNESSGEDGAHHKWVLGKEAEKPAKEQKAINGHKLAKTPGGGSKRTRSDAKTVEGTHGQIDVKDPGIIAKATEYLKSNDWVNKGMFVDAVGLSPGPGNRLIEYMKKEGIIKTVKKKNNPAHDKHGLRKLFVRPMPYIELA